MAIIDNQGRVWLKYTECPGCQSGPYPVCSVSPESLYHNGLNVFVNLFNNQWGTNFTEWIEGRFSAKVYLWSIDKYSNDDFSDSHRQKKRVFL